MPHNSNIGLSNQFEHTLSATDPTNSENPFAVGHLWINSATGAHFTCTDVTTNANVWVAISGDVDGITSNADALAMTIYANEDVTFTGNVTAVSFIGDGSNLTGISSNKTPFGLYEHESRITADYSITDWSNAVSAGPITISAGFGVTIPSNSVWTIL